ncbi:hypothetical protein PsB1_2238 [Candidatus Phycosocius spiralis]|uniref:Uncharacterized protein n=1 Tax=Candidatus Phycosocius spiralis TaxID=2815099 RepID=A0ABQ4PYD8_9PROT|nr:hypothetical protein PsB1_2238 [Candidatus Phycosocius spiralis]
MEGEFKKMFEQKTFMSDVTPVSHPARTRGRGADALLPIVGPLWPRVFGLARVRWAGVTG